METYSFITNNCLGVKIYSKLNREYDNPFIGSYFQDDFQFLKFCSNFDHYIKLKPEFLEPKLPICTTHPYIRYPGFPVMFLDDIEIHWIHETDQNICLDKYNRRLERIKTPFFVWGDSLLHRMHSETQRQEFINNFKTIKNSIYFNKDEIQEWKDVSFDNRNYNDGWAQPVNWLTMNFEADLLINSFKLNNTT